MVIVDVFYQKVPKFWKPFVPSSAKDVSENFTYVKSLDVESIGAVFGEMQVIDSNPMWHVEGMVLIAKLGLRHTSMSVGDLVRVEVDGQPQYHLCADFGWDHLSALDGAEVTFESVGVSYEEMLEVVIADIASIQSHMDLGSIKIGSNPARRLSKIPMSILEREMKVFTTIRDSLKFQIMLDSQPTCDSCHDGDCMRCNIEGQPEADLQVENARKIEDEATLEDLTDRHNEAQDSGLDFSCTLSPDEVRVIDEEYEKIQSIGESREVEGSLHYDQHFTEES